MADMEKQKVLSTEEYNNYIGAGDIEENGIVFTFNKMVEHEGRFEVKTRDEEGNEVMKKKPFWVISGFDSKGLDINISTGSAKLHRLIMDNYVKLHGKKICLAGTGKNFEREYSVTILE
jgi:hypothetical protein